MSGFPGASISRMGNFIVNPGGIVPGALETPMRGPAWWVTDFSPLYGFPDLRGANIVISGANGRRAIRRRIDQGVYLMPLRVTGGITASGAATAVPDTPLEGLEANLDYLWENVGKPLTGATRSGKLIKPSGAELTEAVQTRLVLVKQTIADAMLLFEVIIPRGRAGG